MGARRLPRRLAGLLLVGSGLADRFGRKRIFLAGMAAFGAASVLCALAPSPAALIGARVFMGAAAACVLPPALSLIAVMFPPEERAQALGVWAAVAGAGLVLGPLLGGVLVHEVGWEAVFLINVPLALVVVPAGMAVLPESTRPGTPPLDLLGAALSIVSLGGVVFALIEGPDAGWSSPEVIASGTIGLLAGVVFVRAELRRRHPLFDVAVLVRPAVAAGAVTILSVYIAFLGTLFLLPQYLQYVHGRSVVAAGLLVVPPATAVIMNDLGQEKAGDGGAVNQLARQVGGALGVAIVGSVFAGVYTSQIDEKLARLPGSRRERASESIEEARDVVEGVPQPLRDELIARVDDAFDFAARIGFGVCVGVLLLAAAAAAVALAPDRS